jgi:hypothetical protein
LSIFICL